MNTEVFQKLAFSVST